MKLKIPYNPFLFVWSIIGVCTLSYGFISELNTPIEFSFTRGKITQLLFLISFILFGVNFLRRKQALK